MDVQGSQYHLLNGRVDWSGCTDTQLGSPLSLPWSAEDAGAPQDQWSSLEYDDPGRVLRLHRLTPLFQRAGRTPALDQRERRGAGRDPFGNWYWIGPDQAAIQWRTRAGLEASTWWRAGAPQGDCDTHPHPGFATCTKRQEPDLTLSGLAVTTAHRLLAGYRVPGPGPHAQRGLLVFDLLAGGEPLRIPWPADSEFEPWDIADLPDGGALVLDRVNRRYWRLDEHLRLLGSTEVVPLLFQPAAGGPLQSRTLPARPTGFSLDAPQLPGPIDPVSIEPGPDGDVLILDSNPARRHSLVHLFAGEDLRWSVSLQAALEVVNPNQRDAQPQMFDLLGYDFTYGPGPASSAGEALLYIADSQGNQVIAFELLPGEPPVLQARPDFLPMRRWQARSLARASSDIFYDFDQRWVPLAPFSQCRFATEATLTTPVHFGGTIGGAGGRATPAGAPFDSQLPGCTWHRLLLDAEIPTGTSITVRARASDDPELLEQAAWLPQPIPYLRSAAELPWYDPWPDRRDPNTNTVAERTGTWELLLQQVLGRYLQVELTLTGNARRTPQIRSLRAWYPRFSYAEHYLPAIYPASDSPDRFLERFLANFEGFFTATEELIEHSHLILDARTARAADLPWLASWFGLVLDPQLSARQSRFLVANVDRLYRMRGTVPGLLATLRVLLTDSPDEAVFATCNTHARGVRIIERFRTRTAAPGGPATGNPGTANPGTANPATGDPGTDVADAAHRFEVLVPPGLTADVLELLRSTVEAAKPAHTLFELRGAADAFVVGRARLGIDTELGRTPAFVAMVLGRDELAAGFLGPPTPFEQAERIVADRDRLGAMPTL